MRLSLDPAVATGPANRSARDCIAACCIPTQGRLSAKTGTVVDMRRVAIAALVIVAAACVTVVFMVAMPSEAADRQVFDLEVLQDNNSLADVGATGLSVGDEYVYANVLGRNGKPVGTDGSSCLVTAIDGDKVTTNCVLSVRLPDGQITAQSLWSTGDPAVSMAITGGTGAYRGASGELTCYDILTPEETYHIDLVPS